MRLNDFAFRTPLVSLLGSLMLASACSPSVQPSELDASAADASVQPDRASPPDPSDASTSAPPDAAPDEGAGDAPPGDGAADPCSAQRDCADCTAQASCGWCGATRGCMRGVADGPVGALCASGWQYLTSSCPAEDIQARCAAHTDCAACTTDLLCGWCGASARCLRGTLSGPIGATCSGSWANLVSACPNGGCERFTNCASCGASAGCGWCGASSRCLSGDSSGPQGPGATCAAGWAYSTSSCPSGGCGDFTTCATCATQPQCGWCASSRTCLRGTSDGPINAMCTTWVPTTDRCMP